MLIHAGLAGISQRIIFNHFLIYCELEFSIKVHSNASRANNLSSTSSVSTVVNNCDTLVVHS